MCEVTYCKIQLLTCVWLMLNSGAVTSPTVLPPSSHALSHGIGPPNSCLPDVQVSHKLSAAEDGCNIFFEKDKNSGEPCVHLEDSEAEAEAAASAVAVAAISSDEVVGNGLGCSVSVSDAKTFGAVDVDGICVGSETFHSFVASILFWV